jgi:hypothetical protein
MSEQIEDVECNKEKVKLLDVKKCDKCENEWGLSVNNKSKHT